MQLGCFAMEVSDLAQEASVRFDSERDGPFVYSLLPQDLALPTYLARQRWWLIDISDLLADTKQLRWASAFYVTLVPEPAFAPEAQRPRIVLCRINRDATPSSFGKKMTDERFHRVSTEAPSARVRRDKHVNPTLVRTVVSLKSLVILDVPDGLALGLNDERLDRRSPTADVLLGDDIAP